jgi:hypothetical protein
VAAKSGLDMGDRTPAELRGKRTPERAGRVALHDHEFGGNVAQDLAHRLADHPDVRMGVAQALAVELHDGMAVEAEVHSIESRMLAGEDDQRRDSAPGKRVSNWCKLDRLGTRADDDDNGTGQPSP